MVDDVSKRLKQIINEVANACGAALIEIETDKDYVHLLVEVDPQFGINKFIRLAKGRTSRQLREEFPYLKSRLPTLWTNSYFVSTVGGAPLSVVKQYIANQQLSESKLSKKRWNNFISLGVSNG